MKTKLSKFVGLMLLALLANIVGCACNVQIWGNSDSDDLSSYSRRSPHYIHVGEIVDFKVTVEPDITSYVLVDFCGDIFFAKKVKDGVYSFEKSFDEKWRGRKCNIVVRAFKQNGKRDYRERKGVIKKFVAYMDPPDDVLCQSSMRIYCYQSKIILRVKTSNRKEPDWNYGKLVIFGPEKKVSVIRYGRPGIDGFTAFGPEWSSGAYIVFYEPKADQIHRAGRTKVRFTVPDPGTKKEITVEEYINTP